MVEYANFRGIIEPGGESKSAGLSGIEARLEKLENLVVAMTDLLNVVLEREESRTDGK